MSYFTHLQDKIKISKRIMSPMNCLVKTIILIYWKLIFGEKLWCICQFFWIFDRYTVSSVHNGKTHFRQNWQELAQKKFRQYFFLIFLDRKSCDRKKFYCAFHRFSVFVIFSLLHTKHVFDTWPISLVYWRILTCDPIKWIALMRGIQ